MYSSRDKCLRLVADRSFDKSYPSRSKALFYAATRLHLPSRRKAEASNRIPTVVNQSIVSKCGTSAIHPASPIAAPVSMPTAPTTAPLTSITSRTRRSGQQDPAGQLQLPDIPPGERTQERAQRGRRPDPVEQMRHGAVPVATLPLATRARDGCPPGRGDNACVSRDKSAGQIRRFELRMGTLMSAPAHASTRSPGS